MKARRRNVREDWRIIITRSITRSNHSMEEPLPIDLIFEVLSRLPAKSIAISRCVSKLWASMILRPCFTELFLTRSWARPQVLLACQDHNDGLSFFSSPQLQNPDVSSSPVTANYHMTYPYDVSFEIPRLPVHGLVCVITKRVVKRRKETVHVICNPSTGESLTLPKVTTQRVGVRNLFGYDPIDKQFKVLCMTSAGCTADGVLYREHQVLTLGTGNLLWRKIKCCIPHAPAPEQDICINGVLYYPARNSTAETMLACFDVRSEKFRLITRMQKPSGGLEL